MINGRPYSVACEDGEEAHVGRLGRYVERKVGELAASVGQVGDARLLLMASLVIADELSEAETAPASRLQAADEAALAERVDGLARRIEAIAAELEAD